MSYYDTFLYSSLNPKEELDRTMQQVVSSQFFDSVSYWEDIEQEIAFGTQEYQTISARITNVIDYTTGERIGDDYKKIMFEDFNFKPLLGSRYRFDNNVWIVYFINNIKSLTSSALLRRCNNVLCFQDEYGNIHQEPCYIDNKPTRSGIEETKDMIVPNNKIILSYQLNQWTNNIGINSRFLFGRDAFKIVGRMGYNKTNTFDDNSKLLARCWLDFDNLNEYDNIELQVANYFVPNYSIQIEGNYYGAIGATGTALCTVTKGGITVAEPVTWKSTNEDVAIITPSGEYTYIAQGECEFVATMVHNTSITASVSVEVGTVPVDNYTVKLSPNVDYIMLNQRIVYEFYQYNNNQKTDETFIFTASGLPAREYKFEVIDGNHFAITCVIQNQSNKLSVLCQGVSDPTEQYVYEFEMGGVF